MERRVYIEEALRDVLNETDLTGFAKKLYIDLQLSRLDHFDHVTDEELKVTIMNITYYCHHISCNRIISFRFVCIICECKLSA